MLTHSSVCTRGQKGICCFTDDRSHAERWNDQWAKKKPRIFSEAGLFHQAGCACVLSGLSGNSGA